MGDVVRLVGLFVGDLEIGGAYGLLASFQISLSSTGVCVGDFVISVGLLVGLQVSKGTRTDLVGPVVGESVRCVGVSVGGCT